MPTIAEHDTLPAGSRLAEFEIQQVLGIGGFGVVYLALDHALERQVAIKEYMPASLARRGQGAQVEVRSQAHLATFALGLRSFINEARLLARFDHPSLVKVYRFWEDHGTAYMVMPYYRGLTLQQVRRDMSSPPDEAWLRRLINPLLGALECLHRENVFHRDVAPDNILLLDDECGPGMGRPVLLDLGAARRVIGDHTQTLTAIVKPSFAPIEQYAETVQLRQGPWTDLYALAAVVHFCITGRPPMPATVRAVHDDLPTLRQMSEGLASGFDRHFSEPFVHAIDHALAVRPQDRPDSVAAWREELSGIVGQQGDAARAAPGTDWVAQTVLVRRDGLDAPAGHQAVEAMSYMTTIPAAGKLSAPPAWPRVASPPEAGLPTAREALQPSPEVAPHIPATIPLPVIDKAAPASDMAPAHPRQAPQPVPTAVPASASPSRPWIWALVGLLLLAVLAVWWSSQRARQPDTGTRLASEPGQAASVMASASAAQPARGSQAAQPDKAGKASKAGKGNRSDDSKATTQADEASGALNPRKACGDKGFILLAICMKRHCVKPEYSTHPECVRMRQQEAAQRNVYP